MTVSDQIIAVIKELCAQFGIAIDWTQENILPYIESLCKKFIQYEIYTSIMWMFVPTIFIVILAITSKIFHKNAMNIPEKYNQGNPRGPWEPYDTDAWETFVACLSYAFLAISILVCIIVTFVQIHDIITAITFPEKLIFEYVSGLLNKPTC